MRPAFNRDITWLRAKSMAMSALVCMGRRTVTGMLAASGRQFQDWSADYRLFDGVRMDLSYILKALMAQLAKEIPKNAPLAAAMDDTILKKSGKKTAGVAYRRDPLGPHFHINFIRGQRFLQVSAAIFERTQKAPAKMVPVVLKHAPTPQKPKKNAAAEQWREYRREQTIKRLSRVGLETIEQMRRDMDQNDDLKHRQLIISLDGSYTNEICFKNPPPKTTLIGRIRKDAKLHFRPDSQPGRGRKRKYGPVAPTPEEIRRDGQIPYQNVSAFSAGKLHDFRVKSLGPLKWRKAGGDQELQLLVIAPLGYRLSKNSKILYRMPAYLICTDPHLPLEELLQIYLWRWGIEVNFRDQKTILGMGQAQVRTEHAVEAVPALITAAYAMLLIAAKRTMGHSFTHKQALPTPKWQNSKPKKMSTQKLINQLKAEMWGEAMAIGNLYHFKENLGQTRSQKN